MKIKAMSDQDLIDVLCYTCWREYNKACQSGEVAQRKCERDIEMMKKEIERRMSK